MSDDSDDLEHFALKSSYGLLTGVAIGSHAMCDGFLLMHVGVGCKSKATQLLAHDWESNCNLRQGWTEVGDRDLIMGAVPRIGPFVRSWQDRMGSGFVCVPTATFLDLTGEDVDAEIEDIDRDNPAVVARILAPGFDGDEFGGYALVLAEVIERIRWEETAVTPRQVSLLGYWFDRYEGDHTGNLMQLSGLVKSLGGTLGPTLFSGRSYRDHLGAASSDLLVCLPYLGPVQERLVTALEASGRKLCRADLPIGLGATARWLRDVGAALGTDPRKVAAYAERRAERAMKPLRKMRSRWQSQRIALFAEAPVAAGLYGLLLDLGFPAPTIVGLRGPSLGGKQAFEAALLRAGHSLPTEVEVLESPSLGRIQRRIRARLDDGAVDGLIASATEIGAVRSLEPRGEGPFVVEIGFPCLHYHALQQMPVMGYGGVVSFAQRLLQPPRLWAEGC